LSGRHRWQERDHPTDGGTVNTRTMALLALVIAVIVLLIVVV
jgi:hypothetical protein